MGPTFPLLFQLGSFIDFLSLILVMGEKRRSLMLWATLLSRGKHCQNHLLVSRKIMRFIRWIIGLFADLMDLKCNFSKKTARYAYHYGFRQFQNYQQLWWKKWHFFFSKMFVPLCVAIYHWRTHSKK